VKVELGSASYLKLDEQAAAPTSAATFGYIWVKNTTPNELWWTDDAGGSEQISTSYMLFIWDKETRQYLGYYGIRDLSQFNEANGLLSIYDSVQLDLSKVAYKLFPRQEFHPLREDVIVGADEEGNPIYESRLARQSVDDLKLRDFTADELSKAQASDPSHLQAQIKSANDIIASLTKRIAKVEAVAGVKPDM